MVSFSCVYLILCLVEKYAGAMQWVASRLADIDDVPDKVQSPSSDGIIYVIRVPYGQGIYVGKLLFWYASYRVWLGYHELEIWFSDPDHVVEVLVQGETDQCVWRPFNASDPSEILPTETTQGGHDDAGRLIYVGRGPPGSSWQNHTGGYVDEERTLYVGYAGANRPNKQFDLLLCGNDFYGLLQEQGGAVMQGIFVQQLTPPRARPGEALQARSRVHCAVCCSKQGAATCAGIQYNSQGCRLLLPADP